MPNSQALDPENDDRLLTIDQAAARGRMSRRSMQRKLHEGIIPVARAGDGRFHTLVWSADVDYYWKQLRRGAYRRKRSRG